MKRQVRCGVFETNSSSVHSIAIPRECNAAEYMSFHTGEFGWTFDQADPQDYFYTALYETSATQKELNEKIDRLKCILQDHGVESDFSEPRAHIYDWGGKPYLALDDGYIDHGNELQEFVSELLNDGDKLVRFLSGGLVFTGNDNCGDNEWGYVQRNNPVLDEYCWPAGQRRIIDNPYYMSNHDDYEWYEKGN